MKLIEGQGGGEEAAASTSTPGIEPVRARRRGRRARLHPRPARDDDLIADEDPRDDEGFPRDHSFSFAEAAQSDGGARVVALPPALRGSAA